MLLQSVVKRLPNVTGQKQNTKKQRNPSTVPGRWQRSELAHKSRGLSWGTAISVAAIVASTGASCNAVKAPMSRLVREVMRVHHVAERSGRDTRR